jgi:hypothetical protein
MGRARAMARQLSEQLEREVSAEELLKIENKANANVKPPANTPSIAPPPPAEPEPIHGLDAASTTAAAMHAADPPAADSPVTHSHAAATDAKPPHE